MWRIIKRNFWWYLIELIIGIVFYNINQLAFFLYILFWLLIRSDITTDYLRKLMRVYQLTNELKLNAIIKKLNITQEEFNKILAEYNSKISLDQKKELEEDFKELGFELIDFWK